MKRPPISFSAVAYLVAGLILSAILVFGWYLAPEPAQFETLTTGVGEFAQVQVERFSSVGPRVATDLRGDGRFPRTYQLAEKAVRAFDRRATDPKGTFDSARAQVLPAYVLEIEAIRVRENRAAIAHVLMIALIGAVSVFGISVLAYWREHRATYLVVEMIRGLKTSHLLGSFNYTTLFSALRRIKTQVLQLDDLYTTKDRDLTLYIRLAAQERKRYETVNKDLTQFIDAQSGTVEEDPRVAQILDGLRMRTTGEMSAVTLEPESEVPAVLQMPVDVEVDNRFPYLSRCDLSAGLLSPFRYHVFIPSFDELLGLYDSTDVIKVILDRVCEALFILGFNSNQLSYADHNLRIVMPDKADMSDSEARSIENKVLNCVKNEISTPLMFRGTRLVMPAVRVEISEDTRRYLELL